MDYTQTKAVFKAARRKAGLKVPKEKRGAPARLSLETELRFLWWSVNTATWHADAVGGVHSIKDARER